MVEGIDLVPTVLEDHCLYDLKTDPGEIHNLASNPHYSGVLTALQVKLLERFNSPQRRPHRTQL